MENIHSCWKIIFDKHYYLINKMKEYYDNTELKIYPPKEYIFRIFSMDVKDIKIVLLGQDVYHGYGQANGFAFSVNNNIKIPPSLVNIYTELKNTFPERDYQFKNGNLERWFYEEKIFLLNCGLSVIDGKPGSFIKEWTPFTDDIIQFISENNENVIFLLLGNYAKNKIEKIKNKDKCICGIHPSPLSAHRGFFHSNIFRKIEDNIGYPINWNN